LLEDGGLEDVAKASTCSAAPPAVATCGDYRDEAGAHLEDRGRLAVDKHTRARIDDDGDRAAVERLQDEPVR